LALRRQRQEDHEFEAILSYIARPYLKQTKPNLRLRIPHTACLLAWQQCEKLPEAFEVVLVPHGFLTDNCRRIV
jgi:hypothetical protein